MENIDCLEVSISEIESLQESISRERIKDEEKRKKLEELISKKLREIKIKKEFINFSISIIVDKINKINSLIEIKFSDEQRSEIRNKIRSLLRRNNETDVTFENLLDFSKIDEYLDSDNKFSPDLTTAVNLIAFLYYRLNYLSRYEIKLDRLIKVLTEN